MDKVVKVEAIHTSEAPNIRELFSKCGEIRAFLPYKTNKPDNLHCFIDFATQVGAERALSLKPPGNIHVYSLAMNPHLVNQYRSVALSPLSISSVSDNLSQNLSQCVPSLTDVERNNQATQNNLNVNGQDENMVSAIPHFLGPSSLPSPPVESFFQTLKSSVWKPQDTPQNYLSQIVPSSGCSASMLLPSPLSTISPLTPSLFVPIPPVSQAAPRPTVVSLPSPISPLPALSSLGGAFFSLERRIVMSLCGETITYDLEALEDDPKAIIALLKATSSERGNWMIVAGQYRRKGNPSAAITVVTTMIEVMAANGVPEDDVKFAFLMLSGCETDLWKEAKLAGGEQSEAPIEHYNQSQKWLQKVYGTQQPESLPQPTNALGLNFSDCARAMNTLPVKPETVVGNSSVEHKVVPSSARQREVPSFPVLSSAQPPPASNTLPNGPASVQSLQREIQSLRDRQENHTAIMKATQSAKRRVEADYASERNLRRKLERHLDDLNNELSMARRSENYALEQLKREVAARRRAEDSLEIERDKRKEVEKLAEQRAVKPFYEDLAHMFQRAAQGDEMAFAGYSGGTIHAGTGPFNY